VHGASKSFVSGSLDGLIKVWKHDTHQLVASFTAHHNGVRALRMDSMGRVVSCGTDGLAKVWVEQQGWRRERELWKGLFCVRGHRTSPLRHLSPALLHRIIAMSCMACLTEHNRPSNLPPSHGHDVHLIARVEPDTPDALMQPVEFRTGLRVSRPVSGFVIDLVAKSQLEEAGYILSSTCDCIQSDFQGPLIVSLVKVRKGPDLPLPFLALQLVFRQTRRR